MRTNPEEAIEVAAVQLSAQEDVTENLRILRSMVLQAARRGARLIVLPENLAFMGPERKKRQLAAPLSPTNPVFDALGAVAKEAQRWVIAGGIPEKSDDPLRPYNTCAVFAPDGTLAATYRKIHLFDVDLPDGTRLMESEACLAGSTPQCVDIDGIRVGLSICYDLRFPELYRRLVSMGAQLVVVPAAFTLTTGKDHWHVLLRARAIENQVYVVAAAQFGAHGARTTYGKALIVDPWGTIVAQCSDHVGFCQHPIDLHYLRQVRRSLPCLQHRRL